MENHQTKIIEFNNSRHRQQVVDLWQTVFGYAAEHNSPELSIDKKIKSGDGLFYVAENKQRVIGTVMGGYDGHRGWVYSIAVNPKHRKQGIGSNLLSFVQSKLANLGCLKINLQIMAENESVQSFYIANGFSLEHRISMGKKLY